MGNKRNLIATLVLVIAMIMLIMLAPLVVNIQRSAQAAVTLYSVTQSQEEANFSHWAVGGIPSRGIPRLAMQVGTVTMDSSYVTGGETLDLSAMFPNAVLNCIFATEQGYSFEYVYAAEADSATGLIKAYNGAGAEAGSTGDLSAYVVEYLAIGW